MRRKIEKCPYRRGEWNSIPCNSQSRETCDHCGLNGRYLRTNTENRKARKIQKLSYLK